MLNCQRNLSINKIHISIPKTNIKSVKSILCELNYESANPGRSPLSLGLQLEGFSILHIIQQSSNDHPMIIQRSSNDHPRSQFVKFFFFWNWEPSAIFIIVLFVWLQMWTLFVAKFIPDPEWRNSPKCSFLWLRINERFPKLPFYFKINFLGIDTYLFFLIIIFIFL